MALFGNIGGGKLNFSDTLKYVDEYEKKEITGENGKRKTIAVYKANWYIMKDDSSKTRGKLILSAGFTILIMAALITCVFLNYDTQSSIFVVAPQAFALFPALYQIMGGLNLPYNMKPMEHHRYMHSFIRICRAAAGTSVFLVVALGAEVIVRIASGLIPDSAGDILHILLLMLTAGMSIAVIAVLQSVDIGERPNDWYRPSL